MTQKQRARKSRKRNSDEVENEMDSTDRSAPGVDSDSNSDETQPDSPIISDPTNKSPKRKKSTSNKTDVRVSKVDDPASKSSSRDVRVSIEDVHIPKSANRVLTFSNDEQDIHVLKSANKAVRVSNDDDDHVPKSANKVITFSNDEDVHVPKSANKVVRVDDHVPKSANKVDRVSNGDDHVPKSGNKVGRVSNGDDHVPKSGNKAGRVSNGDDHVPKSGNKVGRVSNEDDHVPKSANRVWSEDDEIAILEGMIDYQSKKGVHPCSDFATFYEFFKNSLNAAVSKTQFTDKIRKLRVKYENKLLNPVFPRPHEQVLFDLSSKIWGSGPKEVDDTNSKARSRKDKKDGKEEVVNATKEKKKDKEKEKGKGETREKITEVETCKYPYLYEAWRSVSFLASSKEMVKQNISLIGSEMASKMNKEWEEVSMMELKLFAKKLELMKKHNQVLLDEMTASQA